MYCKNYLCKKETFADLAGLLLKEDIPLTQKSVSVYLLTVLVANNSKDELKLQECSAIKLQLFLELVQAILTSLEQNILVFCQFHVIVCYCRIGTDFRSSNWLPGYSIGPPQVLNNPQRQTLVKQCTLVCQRCCCV